MLEQNERVIGHFFEIVISNVTLLFCNQPYQLLEVDTSSILDMLQLSENIRSRFIDGDFAIRHTPGHFNGIWTDMATENYVIKASRGSGSTVGITNQKSALVRWTLTRHFRESLSRVMLERAGIAANNAKSHEETKPTAMKRDEEHVIAIVNHLNEP
ncbi:unnamed protein product [Mytilus coruscus]|uniref:Uncharacterized protein n=1 Tax=Mytilus coruscus TaxID=42192 RepID=A0A6J8CQV8_MYTCO|nr:unnamed protein product [Mytilus coruscus]